MPMPVFVVMGLVAVMAILALAKSRGGFQGKVIVLPQGVSQTIRPGGTAGPGTLFLQLPYEQGLQVPGTGAYVSTHQPYFVAVVADGVPVDLSAQVDPNTVATPLTKKSGTIVVSWVDPGATLGASAPTITTTVMYGA